MYTISAAAMNIGADPWSISLDVPNEMIMDLPEGRAGDLADRREESWHDETVSIRGRCPGQN
jgi:hypothetical protein